MNVATISCTDALAKTQFASSLKSTGFAVLRGHPIPLKLISDTYEEWKTFFNLPESEKRRFLFSQDNQSGYFPRGVEKAKGYIAPDIKEFFHVFPKSHVEEISEHTEILEAVS